MTRSSRAATVLMALLVLICPSCSDGVSVDEEGVGVTRPDAGDEPDDVGTGPDLSDDEEGDDAASDPPSDASQGGSPDASEDALSPDVEADAEADVPMLSPEVEVTPDQVALERVCLEGAAPITVRSVGDATAVVTEIQLEGAWTTDAESLPWELAPGEERTFTVTGSGVGRLALVTSAGERVVVLEATLDPPPVVTWTTPTADAVLDTDNPTTFTVAVEEGQTVVWSSSVDGELGMAEVIDGEASFIWNPADQTPGAHVVTASAQDACNTTRAERAFCQQQGFTEDSLELELWQTTGNAFWDQENGRLQLTGAGPFQSGSAFQTQQTLAANNIDIQFLMYAGGNDAGADGMSLTVLDAARATVFIGGLGLGLGYAGLPGWSVEFDTYCNNGHDTTCADHISFTIDGDLNAHQFTTALPNIEDDTWHAVRVIMEGNELSVVLDGETVLDETVTGLTDFAGYVGFTAGTGSFSNVHMVDALAVTNSICGE